MNKIKSINKIKRLIVTLVFPRMIVFLSILFAGLITFTILDYIPVFFGVKLTVILLSLVVFLLLMIIYKPVQLLYAAIWVLSHTIYRIRTVGHENIPLTGGALLVSNTVSYIDHVIIFSAIKRPVKFFVGREFKEHPFLKPFLTPENSIPIDANDSPKVIGRALEEARKSIRNGELVCIFAENDVTHTGNMLPFKRGLAFIMRNNLDAPIIPLHLDRMWGSAFSFEGGRLRWKLPKVIPYPVTVSVGKPMPSSSPVFKVRLAVQELSAEAFKLRGDSQRKLHIGFIHEMKKHPFRFCFGDLSGKKLNYLKVFVAAVALSRRLGKTDKEGEMIGVFLPTTIVGAILNIGAAFAGKVPVNLNFTSSLETLESCIKQCDIKQIVTARAFTEKIDFHHFDDRADFAEDIGAKIGSFEKLAILITALIMPAKFLIKKYVKGDTKNIDDLATVIFSSGTTGEPKGIMLTHQNIVSNIEASATIIALKDNDVLAGMLPLFHAFGYTVTVWLCVYYGIGAALHPNPTEPQKIGELVEKFKCTLLVGTPTFLNSYTRKCSEEQFESLRIIIAGAEKLKQVVSVAFREKFKKTIFEGYGATELSPIVSFGTQCFIDPKTKKVQVGNKAGTVGHPIPGVAAKIVNPETYELLPFGQEGMLMIKGPNVMKGYLNNPEKTAEVIKDGWYVTGDIAIIDDDGFIAITDRLSRFSKIGGEMVPQIRIEEEIHNVVGTEEHFAVVTAVPDDKKGERLVVLYKGDIDVSMIVSKLKDECNLPNLWIPKKENFYKVEDFPILGNGKVDLKKIKQTALEHAGNN
ncbi:MAG: AMP-binding protein [Endomicrobia bacterium]|nr:AMP-binding protein [Endomicrobiia bacterium]MCL2506553.1 AMP-binding protein [Endomicrobiia bacterium]MCL2506610.1 AMP-binding protein [Endomicrobiia bacterium]